MNHCVIPSPILGEASGESGMAADFGLGLSHSATEEGELEISYRNGRLLVHEHLHNVTENHGLQAQEELRQGSSLAVFGVLAAMAATAVFILVIAAIIRKIRSKDVVEGEDDEKGEKGMDLTTKSLSWDFPPDTRGKLDNSVFISALKDSSTQRASSTQPVSPSSPSSSSSSTSNSTTLDEIKVDSVSDLFPKSRGNKWDRMQKRLKKGMNRAPFGKKEERTVSIVDLPPEQLQHIFVY
ncbi:unnamed protein product [Darwinula stevensoni]|uniref:Uncharacterized protein n=1 Tax=Darwinula stevensoni TaxID=69355 RepID=A0A7R8XE65_9CRUS|nr:unnamed protein product [Darwinula stevensoni]CAG0889346.1 unnamed protein product [Darwinula stevensoni]